MNIKLLCRYSFIFIFALLILNLGPLDLDEVWNYGFMHNIYSGLVPYKDFNMVITPFFSFLFSLPFHIFGSNMLVVNICQALLITTTYYILRRLFEEKANFIMIFLFFKFELLYTSYNYFSFFLLILLIFLKKKNMNDYIVGIVIGIAILTKQSVGACLALVSLFYLFNNYRKVCKRIVGALIPISMFIVYLIFTSSYMEFLDLCVFGMFDFGKENYVGQWYLVIAFVICVFLVIYLIKKNKGDISRYYILAFSSMVIPMFDSHHFDYFLLGIILLIAENINFNKLNYDLLMYGCIAGFVIITCNINMTALIVYPNNVNHFQYRYIEKALIDEVNVVSAKLKEYENKEILLLFEQSYYYKIVNDLKIDYFDLINTGNWGYDGSEKLIRSLEKKEDAIFVINRNSYVGEKQTDKAVLNWVLENGNKIDKIYNYEFYVID